jgi:hypothetical protein
MPVTPQYAFGSGIMFGRKTGVTTPTPARFGALQDVSVDISFTTKQLFGQYQYPLAIGRGTAKITGKAKFAQFNAQSFNDLFFNEAGVTAGEVITAVAESATPAGNFAVVTHNATFAQDLGVANATTGEVFQRVTGVPVGNNNYSCNETTGNYGFNSTMNVAVLVSYNYTDAGNGSNIIIANQLLGSAPQFLVVLTETFSSNKLTLQLNACMSSKLTLTSKLEDFWVQEFDFEAYDDAANNVGKLSVENL